MEYQRIEVITGTPRRRRYTAEEKAAAVEACMAPGVSIAEVARRHGVCRSLLFRWRQLAGAVRSRPARAAPAFMPVMLAPPDEGCAPRAPEAAAGAQEAGAMELVFADGRALRFDASVDTAALRRVLQTLAEA